MNVYIRALNNFPTDDWGVTALMGFRMKGTNVKFYEDIEEVPLNRNSMVVGYIEDTKWFFEQMGWKVDYGLSLPTDLRNLKYLKRYVTKVWDCEDIISHIDNNFIKFPFFLKPVNVKTFYPSIIKWKNELTPYENCKEFIISQLIDIVSEYRCYIIDKKIVGCYNYLGDFYQYPNLKLVDEMINAFENAPIGYSIDVAVLKNGETCLIECNDGWSLGNYGLEPKLYTRLLTERWIEILKQNPLN